MKKRTVSIFLAALMLLTALMPAFAYAKSTTPVWDKYSEMGKYKVSTFTFKVKDNDFTYKVWYPKNIKNMSKRPVILYCNGTGANYIEVPDTAVYLEKAASYGYICVTNTDTNTGLGKSMNAGMNALLKFNKKEGHRLYKKLNLKKIGLAGHSQGATCCINLASKGNYKNRKYFKTIFACSLPTPELEASELQNCPYDASLVSIPTLLLSGTGVTDAGFISPLDRSIIPAYKKIKADVVAARMNSVQHSDSIMKMHPYMIAWFEYKLSGNKTAAKAFVGKSPELKTNIKMEDFMRKYYCKPTELTEVKAKTKSFKAYWKTVTKIKGYQLQYSTSKSFKTSKKILIGKKSTGAITVKNLKKNKTYYVRIRTYRNIGGKNYYGKWSKKETVKTK